MKSSERLELIIDEVQTNGIVKVAEISERLGCSEVTIRNDIRKLDQQGVLKKTYGGAVRKENGLLVEFIPGESFLNSDKKYRIAKRAYEYIENGDSIMIDDSTTGYHLAKYIKEHDEKQIVVVTNSILSAAELTSAKHVDLFVVGGHVMGNPPSCLDNMTVGAVGQYHVAKAFVGVNGINLKIGLTSMGTPQMDVKREIIRNSDETYVIADSSKFGNRNMFTVCPMTAIHKVITDTDIKREYIQTARNLNISLDLV
ncbi:MAG: DeoR/GlpR transcriptional regulator [Enterocloster asparagiformis]|nr:DeoR/GlpR transcriptional regulator [Enterocloster asparagiformis]